MVELARIPALCTNCGRAFPSGFAVGTGATMWMYGSRSGPCPFCGGMGDVIDGAWQIVQGLLKNLDNADPDDDEVRRLIGRLADINANPDARAQDVDAAIAASGKAGSALKGFFSKEENIKWAIGLAITALGIFCGVIAANLGHSSPVNHNDHVIVNNFYEQGTPDNGAQPPVDVPRSVSPAELPADKPSQ